MYTTEHLHMKTSQPKPPPTSAATMTLSDFQEDGYHLQQRSQSRSATIILKLLGVPVVILIVLLGVFTLKDRLAPTNQDMISFHHFASTIASSSDPLILKLWNGRAPIGDGMYEDADTTITVYLAQGEQNTNENTTETSPSSMSAAVIICPGGSYHTLNTQGAGHRVARWLHAHGVTAVVLEYRLPHGRSSVPALDAHRAIRTVRSYAVAWQVDPSRIGIMGFSAGGHVAATAGTHFDLGNPEAVQLVDRASCRPDFVVLAYPVVTMGKKAHVRSKRNLLGRKPTREQIQFYSLETQVTTETPPMFLAHALDDAKVSSKYNSKALFEALQGKNISSQYLELPWGGHGLNRQRGPMWDAWQEQSLEWLVEHHFVSSLAS
jgi:acetyl esterase/lipase